MTDVRGADGDLTGRVCDFAATLSLEDIPADVIEQAKRMLLDTTGVAIAGASTDVASILASTGGTLASPSENRATVDGRYARVPGTALEGEVGDAARLLGGMAHALDFDDVHHGMGGHPSSPILSAMIPLADANPDGVDGASFLCAFIAGVEVEIALATALNPGHYERGWHPTAVVGTVGAATAAGRLLGLDADELRHAVGIAASEASGVKANFGTMTKPFHVGMAARNGLEAARLAGAGMTADDRVLERDFGGFLDLFAGREGSVAVEPHLTDLGGTWGIVTPPVAFKPYPCCGSTHGAIDAALQVRNVDGVHPDGIRSIEISTHPRRLDHTDRPTPRTPLDAKFSVQYVVAVALSTGDVWLDDFSDSALDRDSIRSMLDVVTVSREASAFVDAEWGATVRVRTTDGSDVERTVAAPTGSGNAPMSTSELETKFDRCTRGVLADEARDRALSLIGSIETLPNVEALVDVLTVASSSPTRSR